MLPATLQKSHGHYPTRCGHSPDALRVSPKKSRNHSKLRRKAAIIQSRGQKINIFYRENSAGTPQTRRGYPSPDRGFGWQTHVCSKLTFIGALQLLNRSNQMEGKFPRTRRPSQNALFLSSYKYRWLSCSLTRFLRLPAFLNTECILQKRMIRPTWCALPFTLVFRPLF